ncbi:uncharacterized protein LOC108112699 isoform X1 [Drosophila eugracilis]|uniref:uncharacterized protein LOC108112699 isoform X1 n=1 Tax=Drosophila eugracilis TaxID=29029 RepID=UPI0007E805B2|nr:uncharacterized protein LOC108112699 isoform X1 [Drosophila eugracilis]
MNRDGSFLNTFLLISLLAIIGYVRAPDHDPVCGPMGRCWTVNKWFGKFRQTRCVPCKKPNKYVMDILEKRTY